MSTEVPTSFYTLELPELVRLERRKQITDILRTHPSIQGTERMLLRRMTKAISYTDPKKSAEVWGKINPECPSYTNAINIPEDDFSELHSRVQNHLSTEATPEKLRDTILLYSSRQSPKGFGYFWNDSYEVSQTETTKSLRRMRETGIQIEMPSEAQDILSGYYHRNPDVPLIESTKNERIVTINGFSNALMTLMVHDLYDHFFTFNIMDEVGLLELYEDFFKRVGNPQNTDMFAREGELIASVAYANRVWNMVEPGVIPIITSQALNRTLSQNPHPTENQQQALEYLKDRILPNYYLSQRMGYIATSVLIELNEQRRKQGFIRDLDRQFQPTRILPTMDPEYIALIIETVRLILSPNNNFTRALNNSSVLIEEFMVMVAEGKDSPNLERRLQNKTGNNSIPRLVIDVESLKDASIINKSSLPSNVIHWIIDHPEATATQEFLKQ